MKRLFLKSIKSIGANLVEYKSYLSDMGCRVVEITVSKDGKTKEFDAGYWHYQKEYAQTQFKKELLQFFS